MTRPKRSIPQPHDHLQRAATVHAEAIATNLPQGYSEPESGGSASPESPDSDGASEQEDGER